MIADLKPYTEYKDSGLPWLGHVPGHWETRPAFGAFLPNHDRNRGMKEKTVLSLSYGRIIIKPPEKLHGLVPESFETYQIVNPGDIILRTVDLQNDHTSLRVGMVRNRGIITSAYLALRVNAGVNADFGFQFLNVWDSSKAIYGYGSGLRQNLDFTHFKRMPVAVPPPDEQAAIVRFLDWANGRLERAIRAKRKVIALLNEQKQAIIHSAVTRGLDPSGPLKPSGIPWLGDIPQHWEVMRTKLLAHIKTGGRDTVDRIDSASYPFFVRSQTVERIDTYSFDGEAVLTAGDGAGVAKVFHYIDGKFDYHQRVYKFSNFRRVSGQFFFLYLKSTLRFEALDASAKSTVDSLRLPLLQNFPTLVPPSEEQLAIVRAVETETGGLDAAVSRIAREIELLREYRIRLVADVVTGKLDVREAAARLPDEAAPDAVEDDTDPSLDPEAADEEAAV
jgi:type I restriction enzyme S subunit